MSITIFLLLQTQVIAAAAAGVAAEGLSPKDARAEAENAAQLSVALVENAIVILMLVEDHLRLQSKLSCSSHVADGYKSPLSLVSPLNNRSHSLTSNSIGGVLLDTMSDRRSLSNDSGGVPLDVCIQNHVDTFLLFYFIMMVLIDLIFSMWFASIYLFSPPVPREKIICCWYNNLGFITLCTSWFSFLIPHLIYLDVVHFNLLA